MPKSIYLTDEQYQQVTEAARQCGFRVQRGRGSQIALFVVMASNTACSGRVVLSPPQTLANPEKLSARKALFKPSTRR